MATLLPWLAIFVGCGPTTAPSVPSVPIPSPPPTPPEPLLPCPVTSSPFRFEGLREPLFAFPELGSLTRTYRGRVTLPSDLPLDLEQLWILGSQATILDHGTTETTRWVQYEVLATCTTCDHAAVHIGAFDSLVVLTAPTDPTQDPAQASFDTTSTAWMALGLATGDGPAFAEPIAYQQRPDLNSFVQDLATLIGDDIAQRGTSGIDEHGHVAIDSQALFSIDDLVADTTIPALPAPALPWLLPIAQAGIDEALVVWGPEGRSASFEAVDGRYQLDLPADEPADYTLRRVEPDGQGRASTFTYPPPAQGSLQLRAVDSTTLALEGPADAWVVIRGDEPLVCRTNDEGRLELPRPTTRFEVGVLAPQDLELLAYRSCEPSLLCD